MPRVYRDPDEPLDQGDLLEDVPFVRRADDSIEVLPNLGIITSHGCDSERYFRYVSQGKDDTILATYPASVAPVYPAASRADLATGQLRLIGEGRMPRYFLLPEEEPHPERIIDLLYEQPIPARVLESLNRIGSISEDYWHYLLVHMWVRRSRMKPEDVFIGGLA